MELKKHINLLFYFECFWHCFNQFEALWRASVTRAGFCGAKGKGFGVDSSGFGPSWALTDWFTASKLLFVSEFTSVTWGLYPTAVLGPEEAFNKHRQVLLQVKYISHGVGSRNIQLGLSSSKMKPACRLQNFFPAGPLSVPSPLLTPRQ